MLLQVLLIDTSKVYCGPFNRENCVMLMNSDFLDELVDSQRRISQGQFFGEILFA